MKFIELFAGIGGFRHGLEKIKNRDSCKGEIREGKMGIQPDRNGTRDKGYDDDTGQGMQQVDNGHFKCVWANEIDKTACQIYRKNFGDRELIRGDIRRIAAESIPDFDLLTAGFPCQSFSIAGKRKGFGDTRGTLFFEICRIAEAKKPNLLLLENVKGLLSHDGGNTFRIILDSLSELGYDCEWEVLNSKDFGVPQNRERVYIIGYLRGKSRGKVFPIGETDTIYNEEGEAEPDPKGHNRDPSDISRFPLADRDTESMGKRQIALARGQGWSTYLKKEQVAGALEKGSDLWSGNNAILVEEIDRRILLIWITEIIRKIANSKNIRQPKSIKIGLMGGEREDGIAYCLRKAECNAIDLESRIRRLTPIECERLQGFPDRWTEGPPAKEWWLDRITDKQRYECLGNAVTVNVIEEIGRSILKWIGSRKKSEAG